MCRACEESDIEMEEGYCSVDIEEGKWMKFVYSAYSCDSSFDDRIRIYYCPICGEKLNG